VKGHKALKVNAYFAKKDHLAVIQTLRSHIANMITGVTDGFTCKMRAVYAHFPIDIKPKGDNLEITNFLGEKRIRIVKMLKGVVCEGSKFVKDEIILNGNDIELVSRSAALICQSSLQSEFFFHQEN
jgi:large subunit ribosomal protein L9e